MNAHEYLVQVGRELHKRPAMELFGIGIGNPAITTFHPEAITLGDAGKLADALFGRLARLVFGGDR